MIDVTTWMNDFLQKLNYQFENSVWFVGLQGSYGRGEATETSDIDIVVTMSHRELICGFLSGENVLKD